MDKIKILKRNEATATVYVPRALYRHSLKKVRFSHIDVPCRFVEIDDAHLSISGDLWDDLLLPYPMALRVKVYDDTIHFLPIIGLFTIGYTAGSLYPFGKRTEEFRRLLTFTENKGGCAYILTPENINWENGTVNGIFYHKGVWCEHTVPFPQVIYDRVPNRKAERSPRIKMVKEKFQQEYGLPWFNPGFFNKWDIMNSLQNHPVSVQYLPKTYDFNFQSLKSSLETFPSVFIKPKNASHGIGIKQIQKTDDGVLCYENSRPSEGKKHYSSILDFLRQEFSDHHPSQYILQQGITLPKSDGHSFDFRVHTNKDGSGKWQLSAVAAKIAGIDRVTTHVAYGGEVKTLSEVYGKKKALVILEHLKDSAIALSEIIDQQIDGLIGELGLDLVIDDEQRIWLFEANAKPGRAIFTKPPIRKQARLIDHYWFDYCVHLSELLIQKPDWLLTSV